MEKAFQTPHPESPFQVGDYRLKSIREFKKTFDAEIQLSNRDALTTPPAPILKNISKHPRVKDHTALPLRVNLDE